MSLIDTIQAKGPKNILALDGGGIRGMMTVEIPGGMETMLRAALGRGEDFVLADFFDLVAGTSTGAIIATCVSLGMSVTQIREEVENRAFWTVPEVASKGSRMKGVKANIGVRPGDGNLRKQWANNSRSEA